MKVATVKIGWSRSPSADVVSRKLELTKNGETTTIDLGPEVSEYTIEVAALGAVQFRTTVFDSEGNEATSEVYTFTLGDLEAPQPDTGLFHEVVEVRDEVALDPVA